MRQIQAPTFKQSLILAMLCHLALLAVLLIRVSFPSKDTSTLVINPGEEAIQAVAISEKELQSELNRLANLEKKKRDDQLAKEQRIKEEQEKIVQEKLAKERAAEQQRLAEIKKQQQIVADQKRAEDQRKQAAAAEKAAAAKKAQAVAQAAQAAVAKSSSQPAPVAAAAAPSAAPTGAQFAEIERYKAMVRQQIMRYWVVQTGLNKQDATKLFVRVAPTGTVLDVKVVQSSGNEALDRSAIAAVYKASPLPVPQDPELFRAFRELRLTLRPDSILSEG